MKLTEKERRAFSLGRAIQAAAANELNGTFEGEILEQATREAGRTFTKSGFVLPWELIPGRRDMTVAGVSGSQFLTGTENQPAADTLYAYSVAMRAGITVLPDRVGNVTIPRVVTDATGYWLPDELSAIDVSQPEIGLISMSPRSLGALVTISHQMRAQGQGLDAFLAAHLKQTIGRTLDQAILAGTGADGQPLGLMGTSGVHTETGANLAWAGLHNMLEKVATGDGADNALAWIAAPGVRELLASRERFTGAGPCWDGRQMAGFEAHATTAAPTGSLFLGPWSEIVLGLWGPLQIDVNPGAYFASGKIQMRVMAMADVACRHPAAFSVATSIS